MNGNDRPEGRPNQSVGTHHHDTRQVADVVVRPADAETFAPDEAPVIGTVLYLADPELVAAEIIERRGPDYGRSVAAWVLMLADEVSS